MNRATAESIPLARDVGRSNASFGPPAAPRTWRRIVFCAAVLVTVAEALLLQRKSGLFTGGFLTDTPFHTCEDAAAFLLILLLMNATAVAPLCHWPGHRARTASGRYGRMAARDRGRLRPHCDRRFPVI
jgi:hypothetical protein